MTSKKPLKVLSRDEIFSERPAWRKPGRSDYYAMYSSVFGGVVTDPALMVVPVDDHMVHRGDGIFETCKSVNGNIYNLGAHLSRLQRSAEIISLPLPCDLSEMGRITVQTVSAGGRKDCGIRVLVSRGFGGFSCAPKECVKSNLYIVSYSPWVPIEGCYTKGVSAVTSQVPVKPSFFPQVKSCNYLPNALADMDAERDRADFAVFLDEQGCLAEGATESVAIVSSDKILRYPLFDRILKGTTLIRGMELAQELIETGELRAISQTNIPQEEVYNSSEMLILGTGPNVLPVVTYDGKVIGNGKPGPVFRRLSDLFHRDVTENKKMLTPCF